MPAEAWHLGATRNLIRDPAFAGVTRFMDVRFSPHAEGLSR